VDWYRKASSQGYPQAHFRLGYYYEVVKEEPQEAASWYRKAADMGHGTACARLAALYKLGRGVSKDEKEVSRLRMKARAELKPDDEEQEFRLALIVEPVGQEVPECEVTFGGKPHKLSEQRGKVLFLCFTADWCPASKKMDAYKKELVQRLKGQQFALINIDVDKETKPVIDWRIRTVPRIFIIDQRGIIRAYYEGYTEGAQLDKMIDRLLAD
jgi:hypothetical protein